jgi:hypothetical protein
MFISRRDKPIFTTIPLVRLRTQCPLNIQQRLHPDNSTTNARPVAPTRSPDVHWPARVCLRADSASCRSTASLHMSDTSGDAPNMNRSLCILRILGDAAA